MLPKIPRLRRIREVLRPIVRLPQALPAWIALITSQLLRFVDWADRADFLREKVMGGAPTNWLTLISNLGLIFGFLWFGGLVIWAAARQPSPEYARAKTRLNETILFSIARFEALCCAYERSLTQAHSSAVEFRRIDLMFAVAEVLKAARETLPEERRHEFDYLFRKVIFDHLEFYDGPRSLFADSASPTYAIELALGMTKQGAPEAQTNGAGTTANQT